MQYEQGVGSQFYDIREFRIRVSEVRIRENKYIEVLKCLVESAGESILGKQIRRFFSFLVF